RRRQHRRSLPDHRFDRQPPPRPPQSTIPQLTSLLINNAGALELNAGGTPFVWDGSKSIDLQNPSWLTKLIG
ncbi:hypothetical protein OSH32_23645, partial [Mycobacterium ulcerans]